MASRQSPIPNKKRYMKLISFGKEKIRFREQSVTKYINHTLGKALCYQIVGLHKKDSMFVFGVRVRVCVCVCVCVYVCVCVCFVVSYCLFLFFLVYLSWFLFSFLSIYIVYVYFEMGVRQHKVGWVDRGSRSTWMRGKSILKVCFLQKG